MTAALQIRPLTAPAEIRRVEDIQRAVWGAGDVVPHHLLLASAHHGGILLGAFVAGRLAGFVFGFPALEGSRLHHHSHMLGVLPEFQNAGLGFALKYAQWELVRQAGMERITWTYDPLQSRNAHLNLARLGAVCRTYLPEYYGEMPDEINRGLPSDRFQVDVWVNSPRVLGKMSASPPPQPSLDDYFSAGVELLNPVKQAAGGFPRPPEGMWQPPQGVSLPQVPAPPGYLLEIPADFPALKAADAKLALHWRMHTRRLFTDLFARGWHAADFVYVRGDAPRCFYLLRPAREVP